MSKSYRTGMKVVGSSIAGGVGATVEQIDFYGDVTNVRTVSRWPWLNVIFGDPQSLGKDNGFRSAICVADARVNGDVLDLAEAASEFSLPLRLDLTPSDLRCQLRGLGERLMWHYSGSASIAWAPLANENDTIAPFPAALKRRVSFSNLHLMGERYRNDFNLPSGNVPSITIFAK